MNVYKHYNDFPKSEWKWKDFAPREIACRGDNNLAIDIISMNRLQSLRDMLGVPLVINSAYRSPTYNAKVGGAKSSQHLKAKAFDISMANHNPIEFERAARAVGFTGFGFYKRQGFMHIDTGPAREWGVRWPNTGNNKDLAPEPVKAPDNLTDDKDTKGLLAAAGGAVVSAVPVINSVGSLSPAAQTAAIIGVLLVAAGVAYVFRNKLKALAG